MADENASTLGQHPRIDGKGKIAKVAIFGSSNSSMVVKERFFSILPAKGVKWVRF
jgi:hypothetical protein